MNPNHPSYSDDALGEHNAAPATRANVCDACGGVTGPWLQHQVVDPEAYYCECDPDDLYQSLAYRLGSATEIVRRLLDHPDWDWGRRRAATFVRQEDRRKRNTYKRISKDGP